MVEESPNSNKSSQSSRKRSRPNNIDLELIEKFYPKKSLKTEIEASPISKTFEKLQASLEKDSQQ